MEKTNLVRKNLKTVGKPEDIIPFAWRYPLKLPSNKKMTKLLKNITEAENGRTSLMPEKQK